eukprot:scaffold1928_cov381-Prasinococcus_capsulatus_cf.AAC.31
MKCIAVSLIADPLTTTLAPESAMALMYSSIWDSSPLAKFWSCSALSMRTVPFVSVALVSMPVPNTAILALATFLMVPSLSRLMIMPLMTWLVPKPVPVILATRTLSTLKLAGLAGHVEMHASAINGHNRSS